MMSHARGVPMDCRLASTPHQCSMNNVGRIHPRCSAEIETLWCSSHVSRISVRCRRSMAISDATRKVLWARSHNRCAICRALLAVDADSADLPWLILGEEAHIIARKPGGPRGLDGDRTRLDEYENLILLCADDHKRVDLQPNVYSTADLRARKLAHERWAEEKFAGEAEEPIRLVKAPDEDSIPMQPVATGAAVWDLVAGSGLYFMRSIEDDSDPRASDAADEFLSNARDYGDVSAEILAGGFSAVREAQRSLQEMLMRLWEHDLFVYGRRVTRTLTGGKGAPTPFAVTHLIVLASDELRN